MGGPYLIGVRTGGELKRRLRDVIRDVADEFGVRGAVDPQPVPHVTLFGPYDTDRGSEVKDRLLTVFEEFDIVPYRIDGVGTFPETGVVYARVVPSPELRELRRSVSRKLRPVCEGYPDYDSEYHYEFHVTVAFRDVGSQFEDIRRYVRDQYALRADAYATRITSLRGRSMLWEYDLPRGEVLDPETATTADSWRETERALDQLSSSNDHDELTPSPGRVRRTLGGWKARLSGDW
jgi:2'-5' RNA ligase